MPQISTCEGLPSVLKTPFKPEMESYNKKTSGHVMKAGKTTNLAPSHSIVWSGDQHVLSKQKRLLAP